MDHGMDGTDNDRLAYAEAAPPTQMTRDCHAAAATLHLPRQVRRATRRLSPTELIHAESAYSINDRTAAFGDQFSG